MRSWGESAGADDVEIRVLGGLEVWRAGRRMPLPCSRKTRALLGYLVISGRAQSRERLCRLLWEGPRDPRAELRWSLCKLRAVLCDDEAERLRADHEQVAFEARGTRVDLAAVRQLMRPGRPGGPSLDELEQAAQSFRGELLEGLELPDCTPFHEWCLAERGAARELRTQVLAALVERVRACPNEALRWARERVALDPLVEEAHAQVISLLGAQGRVTEALAQYERCRRLLAAQLGAPPSACLERARMRLRTGTG